MSHTDDRSRCCRGWFVVMGCRGPLSPAHRTPATHRPPTLYLYYPKLSPRAPAGGAAASYGQGASQPSHGSPAPPPMLLRRPHAPAPSSPRHHVSTTTCPIPPRSPPRPLPPRRRGRVPPRALPPRRRRRAHPPRHRRGRRLPACPRPG